MKILYIFPHPDDESFGPAPAISKQKRAGHQVSLLTLTKGGATKQRFKYDYSVEEMGEVRFKEMQKVAQVLQLDYMKVLDFPDSGLKEVNPHQLQNAIEEYILAIQPHIVITYAVHGISGFHDHLVSHAVVKNAYTNLQPDHTFLKRLAFFTIDQAHAERNKGKHQLNFSTPAEIDCRVKISQADLKKMKEALHCYATYKEVIKDTQVLESMGKEVVFEIFQEGFDPPLTDLTAKI